MYEANIQKQHLKVFEFRLQKIQSYIDKARTLISSYKVLQKEDIYISGGCAAWLIGRTDTYDKINIHIFGRDQFKFTYLLIYDDLCAVLRDYIPEPLTLLFKPFKMNKRFKRKFKFPALSVFINLFDTNKILTTECRCNYESNCLITQNDCRSHSRVLYPFLLESKRNGLYYELENEVKQIIRVLDTGTHATNILSFAHTLKHFTSQQDIDRLVKVAKRLLTDPELYPNRIMSFCDYSCSKCKKRDKLTKKYADIWRHKTYAPDGKWCKAASLRFKGMNTDLFKEDCTCKTSYQVAKRQRIAL